MTNYLLANKILKSLSDTRQSTHVNAINGLQNAYFHISQGLITIATDINQPGETSKETQSLAKKNEKIEDGDMK